MRGKFLFFICAGLASLPLPAFAMTGVGHGGGGGSGPGSPDTYASLQSRLVEDARFLREAILGHLRHGGDENFWALGYGGGGHNGATASASALSDSTAGGMGGVEFSLNDDAHIGFAVGHSETWLNAKASASKADIGSTQVAVYAGATLADLDLRAGALYAWHDIAMRRAQSATYASSYDAQTAQVFAETDRKFDWDAVWFEPFANLAWVHQNAAAFTETGAANAYAGSGQTRDVGFANLGARIDTHCNVGPVVVSPFMSAAWQGAFGGLASSVDVVSAGTGTTVEGVPVARNGAALQAGVKIDLTAAARLSLLYDGVFTVHDSGQAAGMTLTIDF